jgi:hypothetical protein
MWRAEVSAKESVTMWWWIFGFIGLFVIGTIISDSWKSWKLRSLSPAQRRIVELRLQQRKLRVDIAFAAKGRDAGAWERAQAAHAKCETEAGQLFDALDEKQRQEMFRGLDSVW